MNAKEKKPIKPTLKTMSVGDVEEFERHRFESVSVTISKLHYISDLRFETTRDGISVKVKRVS